MSKSDTLTVKQEAACQEFVLNSGKKSAAYRHAYDTSRMKPSTVNEKASRLFAEDKIKARVAELKKKTAEIAQKEFNIDAKYVLGRLVEIDRMDVLDIMDDKGVLLPVHEWPESWRRYISGLDITEVYEGYGDAREVAGLMKKIKWPDKVKNLDLIGKHVDVQAWRDKVDLSSSDGSMSPKGLDASKLSTEALKEIVNATEQD